MVLDEGSHDALDRHTAVGGIADGDDAVAVALSFCALSLCKRAATVKALATRRLRVFLPALVVGIGVGGAKPMERCDARTSDCCRVTSRCNR